MPGPLDRSSSTHRPRPARTGLGLGLSALLGVAVAPWPQARAQTPPPVVIGSTPRFLDAGPGSGVVWVGQTFGVSCADHDGDGLADIALSCHAAASGPRVFRSLGGFRFQDVTATVLPGADRIGGDRHACAWFDLENDGDRDLVMAAGGGSGSGASPNLVWVMNGGVGTESAHPLGLDQPRSRGRMFSAVDWDLDGRLDLLMAANERLDGTFPTTLFRRRGDAPFGFAPAVAPGFARGHNEFAQLTTLPGVGSLLFVHGYPLRAYRLGVLPAVDLAATLGIGSLSWVTDTAFEDFDNDGVPELFAATGVFDSTIEADDDRHFTGFLRCNNSERGFDIVPAAPPGRLVVDFEITVPREQIRLGAQGRHPSGSRVVLSPHDAELHGSPSAWDGSSTGIRLGWDPALARWWLRAASPNYFGPTIRVTASSARLQVAPVGFATSPRSVPLRLLSLQGSAFVDRSTRAGMPTQGEVRSCVAADFDNDMDLDLFLVRATAIGNLSDWYLENQGGSFVVHHDGAGAGGTTTGVGDTAAAADFDGDGVLDLCVANGGASPQFASDGVLQVFRGMPTPHHWVRIALVGGTSNRDGIGSKVIVSAGGVVQTRLANGGLHGYAQNDPTLHFGLANHAVADRIEVEWPSGRRSVLSAMAADRVITVVEP